MYDNSQLVVAGALRRALRRSEVDSTDLKEHFEGFGDLLVFSLLTEINFVCPKKRKVDSGTVLVQWECNTFCSFSAGNKQIAQAAKQFVLGEDDDDDDDNRVFRCTIMVRHSHTHICS